MTLSEKVDECNRIGAALFEADDRIPFVRAYETNGGVVLAVEGLELRVNRVDLPISAVRAAAWRAMQARLNKAEMTMYTKESK